MKLKCIDNSGCDGLLTIGEVYDAEPHKEPGWVRLVKNDAGFPSDHNGMRFEMILETATATPPPAPGATTLALPTDSAARKAIPMARGCLDYFPAALAAVAELSRKANEKHNPGEPMHHARGKSSDHADCILRHLVDRGTVDPEDNIRHSVKVAWRALALLQEELEAAGAPLARGARK